MNVEGNKDSEISRERRKSGGRRSVKKERRQDDEQFKEGRSEEWKIMGKEEREGMIGWKIIGKDVDRVRRGSEGGKGSNTGTIWDQDFKHFLDSMPRGHHIELTYIFLISFTALRLALKLDIAIGAIFSLFNAHRV